MLINKFTYLEVFKNMYCKEHLVLYTTIKKEPVLTYSVNKYIVDLVYVN